MMDDRRRTPSDGKSSHCLWQGAIKRRNHANMKMVIKLGKNLLICEAWYSFMTIAED